mmetsp:Transcript_31357/g.63751  ORF Transcript_31357/g.63751 Transcript_31357/m.63751 type:complete len:180 (+) Transcript_31357:631-1170(+)
MGEIDHTEKGEDLGSNVLSYESLMCSLLGIAMSSAARHAVRFRTEQTLSEAVTEEIQAHVRRKYEALVLRPAITDPLVHRAFVRSLKAAHSDYLAAVQDLEQSVSAFVLNEAQAYARPPRLRRGHGHVLSCLAPTAPVNGKPPARCSPTMLCYHDNILLTSFQSTDRVQSPDSHHKYSS